MDENINEEQNDIEVPFGPWKGYKLRTVPQSYLRWHINLKIKKTSNFQMFWKIKFAVELDRRRAKETFIHATEHFIERFTQYWPRALVHYRYFCEPDAGLITMINRLFNRALSEGLTLATKDSDKFHIVDRLYRYTYAMSGPNLEHYSLITVIKNKRGNKEEI